MFGEFVNFLLGGFVLYMQNGLVAFDGDECDGTGLGVGWEGCCCVSDCCRW